MRGDSWLAMWSQRPPSFGYSILPPFCCYVVVPVARKVWQQVVCGNPACRAPALAHGQHLQPKQPVLGQTVPAVQALCFEVSALARQSHRQLSVEATDRSERARIAVAAIGRDFKRGSVPIQPAWAGLGLCRCLRSFAKEDSAGSNYIPQRLDGRSLPVSTRKRGRNCQLSTGM